jgi:hypothetical protein
LADRYGVDHGLIFGRQHRQYRVKLTPWVRKSGEVGGRGVKVKWKRKRKRRRKRKKRKQKRIKYWSGED